MIIVETSVPIMSQLSEHDLAVLNSIFNPLLPLGEAVFPVGTDNDELDSDGNNVKPEIAAIVKRAILAAEAKDFEEAFRLFQQVLQEDPHSPTILNDRAQALRLAGRDEEAINDLNLAVELSNGKGKTGIRALCQRAILNQSLGKMNEAREDFTMAANGGSSFARTQLVALNPYAAMCNNMLRDITKVQSNLS